ncbi:hypothetical protein CWC43_06895 [Klebsiella aerogenes]|nr:hypothetical protein CWC42_19395 [Klebsiella aerogenes]RXX31441.1 hypothetical protein CWC43_06895 [Klebsiella aerogenes]
MIQKLFSEFSKCNLECTELKIHTDGAVGGQVLTDASNELYLKFSKGGAVDTFSLVSPSKA